MAKNKAGAGPPLVRRITLDEKLDKHLMRILVADLKRGSGEFNDDPEYWRPEEDIVVTRDEFRQLTGMAPRHEKKWPWGKLFEGQVFLEGYFKTKPGRRGKPDFVIVTDRKNLLCINNLIKKDIKRIYFSALKGGTRNGG